MDIDAPKPAISMIDNEEPIRATPNKENEEDIREKLLNDSDAPK
jgi:hypothetical protein